LKEDKKETVLIIDANSLAHRCVYAHKDLGYRNKEGNFIYTGLAYGFITNLIMLNEKFAPKSIIIVWDGGCGYRRKLFPGYKLKRHTMKDAQRAKNIIDSDAALISKEKPPHMFAQEVSQLKDILRYMPARQCILPGEEADDLIGYLTKKVSKLKKYETIICSNDYDFMQLLQYDNTKLFRSYGGKEEMITRKSFMKEYGIEPKYYANVLAIGGDATDEYKGVVGISEKTAFEIVKKFGPMLRDILNNTATSNSKGFSMSKAHASKITNQREQMILCKKLAKIRTELPEDKIMYSSSVLNLEKLKKELSKNKFHSFTFDEKLDSIKLLPSYFIEF
jgi:5'-3' exonuclease